ncbi:MAG: class I SAM-dependent methyltransferase [Lentisphaerae bacterium]|nr:class I SAM-dependent methyltransferase [Lentisphaerota bacterium]
MNVTGLYRNRFPSSVLTKKQRVWNTLCKFFFSRFIETSDTVLDLGAGYCEFINNIQAQKKIAFDSNPDIHSFAAKDVEVINQDISQINDSFPPKSIDKVFISNFLEHLSSREDIEKLFHNLHIILADSGNLIILQPNIRYVKHAYWDFFDHKIPLTEKSLTELCLLCGFEIALCIKKFLPYTFKSAPTTHPVLVWLYIRLMPVSNFLFGKQTLLIAKKAPHVN